MSDRLQSGSIARSSNLRIALTPTLSHPGEGNTVAVALAVIFALLLPLTACQRTETERAEKPAARPAEAPPPGIPPAQLDRIVELFNKGVGLMERYQPLEAVRAFEEVVRLAPNWTTGRLNYGIALLNAQTDEGYAAAEVELKKVVAEAPDNPYAHYALGMLLRHLTRFDEAKAQFEAVLRIDPLTRDADGFRWRTRSQTVTPTTSSAS